MRVKVVSIETFNLRVKKLPGRNACWVWTGSRLKSGYGQVKFLGRKFLTHRVSWILYFGEIPSGLDVLHKCDNPSCVRASHLFVGTHQDNMDDMRNKGRATGRSLSISDVIAMRKKYAIEQCTLRQLAAEFGCSKTMAWYIIHNVSRLQG